MRDACLDFSKSEIQMNEQKVANAGLVELTATEVAEVQGEYFPSLLAFMYSGALIQEMQMNTANEMWAGEDPARGFGESSRWLYRRMAVRKRHLVLKKTLASAAAIVSQWWRPSMATGPISRTCGASIRFRLKARRLRT
jgi:hypothetical protein